MRSLSPRRSPVLIPSLLSLLLLAGPARAAQAPERVAVSDTGSAVVSPEPIYEQRPFQPTLRKPAGPPLLKWNPAWPKVRWGELAATGLGAALTLGSALVQPLKTHRRGGILFDGDVRSGMRLGSLRARERAADFSDVLLTFNLSYPYVVDALAIAGWQHRSPRVAMQMTLIDLEVMTVTAGIQGLTNMLVSRERPYGRDCGGELDPESGDCVGSGRYRSFFSGHTALTFSAAAVTCAHHRYLRLHGSRGADAVPCVAGFVLAGTTGALRIAADRHYISDVLIGATVGTLVGYGIPYLFHYRHGAAVAPIDEGPGLSFTLVPASVGTGAGVAGAF
ncbi:MAG: phosphatase PAP2 family protein [Deltaproteobacteria bacterium]|nr:phosphatase PAP2 family protein [Deltaproteobacteria bacterium]